MMCHVSCMCQACGMWHVMCILFLLYACYPATRRDDPEMLVLVLVLCMDGVLVLVLVLVNLLVDYLYRQDTTYICIY